MNDFIENIVIEGEVYFNQNNIYHPNYDVELLRTQVGMVFQKPNPFHFSITDNITYALKAHGLHNPYQLNLIVEKSLKNVGLYDEVKDNLTKLATTLSGGQQQRLCIARAIASEPEILLMDEPTSALDPISVARVEELIVELGQIYTIIIVSHSMSQVKRISDFTVYMENGEIIESNVTRQLFTNPKDHRTLNYVSKGAG
ncbi:Phosphate ABC transporter, ATP-binding protein PstB [[Mycoplasma] cavipharyngis]